MTNIEKANARLDLPPVLDLVAASALLEAFLRRRGAPLVVDGRHVQRFGGQCLQVLLAARAAWAADEQDLRLEYCSEDLSAALELLGVTPETLTTTKEMSS